MVTFLLKEDIEESTILNSDSSFRLESSITNNFLKETNEWYTEEAIELGVDETDIMVYNPNVDIEDKRNKAMVKLCEYYFLKNVFFSLSKIKDDIYWIKYEQVSKLFDNYVSKMTINRIEGISPATIKTPNSYMTIRKYRGEVSIPTTGSSRIYW